MKLLNIKTFISIERLKNSLYKKEEKNTGWMSPMVWCDDENYLFIFSSTDDFSYIHRFKWNKKL